MSKKVLQYVEIDVDYCSLNYGVNPCQARTTITPINAATKLLLHFEKAAGSTEITDSSPAAHGNATLFGNTVIVDNGSNGLFSHTVYLDGTGDFFTFPNSADWDFGNGAFTIDWWEYRLTGADAIPVMCRDGVTNTFQAFLVGWSASGRIQAYSSSNGSSWDILNAFDMGNVIGGAWVHRALVRSGNTFYAFQNGVLQNTTTSSATLLASSNVLSIGRLFSGATLYYFFGYLEEVRIAKGLARWTANFDPVTAADLPATGSTKCFNTLVTCQDRANFNNVPVTLRFAYPTNYLPKEIDCIPNIKEIGFDPAVISLGENLGQRATLTVSFDDHRHSDAGAGFDKYLADSPPTRIYDPYSQGTFWGKFRARQPFVRGRNLRWITGTLGQALTDMETRHYIIESFSGPDNNGKFSIIAKDVLKLADGDRALAPAVSNGFLNAALTNVATTFTVSPTGIGDAEYLPNGWVAIGGSEIVIYSRSGDNFTVTRAQLGTAASAHSAQDRVQQVLYYNAQSPDLIIRDLLQNYAGIYAPYIPFADWSAEVSAYLNRLYTAVIAQPTSVNTLVSELIEQAGLSMWWDDRNQEIGLLVLRGLVYTTYRFSKENVIADSFEATDQPEKRLSQVHTYFGQINPLTSLTDKANYRSVSIITDAQAETDYGSAAIKEIFSRWIPALGRTIADRLGSILLSRFTDAPRHIKVSVLRGSTPEIELARGYQCSAIFLQDETGAEDIINMQVTRLQPSADIIQVEADEVIYTAVAEDLVHRQIIIDSNSQNINLRTVHDQIFPAPDSSVTVICTINAGIQLSSASFSLSALDIGLWPSGVTIIINVLGDLRGAGGQGGNWDQDSAGDGGTAIFARYPFKLAMSAGSTLWSGGGGGGGSQYGGQAAGSALPSGGGGGAGIVPGTGGFGSAQASSGTATGGGAPSAPIGSGGYGGAVGQAGVNGFQGTIAGVFYPGYPGHRAGYAIDGISVAQYGTYNPATFAFTPTGIVSGDIRGTLIN